MRFFLTPAELEDTEQRRHAAAGDILMLYLGLDAIVAGIKNYNSVGPNGPSEETPWDHGYGIFSQVLPFWTSQVPPLVVAIEQSTWVRDVLPGLGYDRSRLIELRFPPPLPDHLSAASQSTRPNGHLTSAGTAIASRTAVASSGCGRSNSGQPRKSVWQRSSATSGVGPNQMFGGDSSIRCGSKSAPLKALPPSRE
jgi:hypothetical protein